MRKGLFSFLSLKVGVVAAAAATACVPATEDLEPRGAAGITIEPDAVAKGEPFTTTDGWTIRLEQLAFCATIFIGGYGRPSVWKASQRFSQWEPGLDLGPTTIHVYLSGLYFLSDYDLQAIGNEIEPSLKERFLRPPENRVPSNDPANTGPAVVLIAQAQRGEQRVSLDVALELSSFFAKEDERPKVEVRANAITYFPFTLSPKSIFIADGATEAKFDAFAAADRDGDGKVTASELKAVRLQPPSSSKLEVESSSCWDGRTDNSSERACARLLDLLSYRLGRLFSF